MSTSLEIVQEFFPEVSKVRDAKEPLTVEVTKRDSQSATVRNHKSCALAVACKRKEKADGMIVSVTTAYVIKGDQAIRYKLKESASREVVSFDRNGGFAEGEYELIVPGKGRKLGEIAGGRTPRTGEGKKIIRAHKTTGIRTVLGSHQQ